MLNLQVAYCCSSVGTMNVGSGCFRRWNGFIFAGSFLDPIQIRLHPMHNRRIAIGITMNESILFRFGICLKVQKDIISLNNIYMWILCNIICTFYVIIVKFTSIFFLIIFETITSALKYVNSCKARVSHKQKNDKHLLRYV